jgi:hypothetical protein
MVFVYSTLSRGRSTDTRSIYGGYREDDRNRERVGCDLAVVLSGHGLPVFWLSGHEAGAAGGSSRYLLHLLQAKKRGRMRMELRERG